MMISQTREKSEKFEVKMIYFISAIYTLYIEWTFRRAHLYEAPF